MFHDKLNYKLINITVLMVLIFVTVSNIETWWQILTRVTSILSPFLIAFAGAYAYYPIIKFLEKKGMKKAFAVTTVVLATLSVVILLLVLTLPLVYEQLVSFTTTILDVISNLSERYRLNLGPVEVEIENYLNDVLLRLGSLLSTGIAGLMNGLLSFMGRFIVGFVAWIYFLSYMKDARRGLSNFLRFHSNKSFLYVKRVDKEFSQYLKGLMIFMTIQFFQYSFLFFIVNHPNWLILGILSSLTSLIPYFGGLITNIIAVITATLTTLPTLIGTIIICLIFPQLDGYLISPKIYGKTNKTNPLITIIAVSVGGTVAGIPGIIVAFPVYLYLKTTYDFFKKDLQKSMKKMKQAI